MAQKKGQSRDLESERQVRSLEHVFRARGISVRREKLCAGPAFKVKSGECLLSGSKLIFVDRRLSAEQQLTVLMEHLIDAPFDVADEELSALSATNRELVRLRKSPAPAPTQHAA
ncbi:MAG: hypothetical protein U0136_15270 [Bdellovibrionota bacterium]